MGSPMSETSQSISSNRISESTVARIAGNIASGLASKADVNGSGLNGAEGVAEWAKSIVLYSVGLARAIVAEVQRTEPEPEAMSEVNNG